MSDSSNVLRFSSNWNNKLNCKFFTTLRPSVKWLNQPTVIVQFKDQYKVCSLIEARKLHLWQLNEFNCRIDTGYSLKETLDIIGKMYNFDPEKENRIIYMYLYEVLTDWLTLPEAHDILG